MTKDALCLTPAVHGVGGMVSFREKLSAGLAARGVRLTTDLDDPNAAAVLVIGGTRDLAGLRRARRRGARIVQRLDGMNWLHRRRRTGLRHFVRAELGNLLLRRIRSALADAIVYQSEFSRNWWERVCGPTPVDSSVVYNGVDLAVYTPDGPTERPADAIRLLLVEGSLQGGYETGLETARQLRAALQERIAQPVRLAVAGKVSRALEQSHTGEPIDWLGLVLRAAIPALDRSAHLLYSADLNAACPNSVIEALACGLPVVAFDTGALPELVDQRTGRVVPYGGDPWRLDPPDVAALARGAEQILEAGEPMRIQARRRAEDLFGLETMVAGYLTALKLA